MHAYRSHTCADLRAVDVGSTVRLSGWIHRKRDHGGVLFVDLRDHYGLTQLVCRAGTAALATLDSLRVESVVTVTGEVVGREGGAVNARLATGDIEVVVDDVAVQSSAAELPMPVAGEADYPEEIRLKYRYLDLRREPMQKNLKLRYRVSKIMRDYLDASGFMEVETPMLTRSTPEGARDYLVPSRVHDGMFYALPQSPQLFKQILMVAGFDRYYQIARCFRDEALRADRQLEFTQLDMEFAWVAERDVQDSTEAMIRSVFREVMDVELVGNGESFPRLTYAEAMRRFGSDKPDLRIAMELTDIAELVAGCEFKVFTDWANADDGRVAALRVPGGATLSRKQIDDYAAHAAKYGAKGLAWMKVEDPAKGREGVNSPIAKFLDDATLAAILAATSVQTGDLLLFGAARYKTASDFMGALRLKLGKDLNLITAGWAPLWVTDFPMFEWDDDAQRYVALHHPFTAPAVDDVADLRANARTAVSRGYDMVLNGNEIGGGSIRIHNSAMQSAVFELLGIGAQEAQDKFGFLLDALKYGAPPHGGIAFGIDRIAALMAGTDSIRDVIAFPKTTTAQCLMTGAPSPIPDAQLAEVHVAVRPKRGQSEVSRG